MTLFELQAWLGHRSPQSTQFYAKITPTTLTRAYDDAGYFARNVRTIEVLIDRDAINSGAAATGQPWQHYDLGHGYCTYTFFEQCPHRMACARCDFYTPKDSSKAQLPEAKDNLQRMLTSIPLTDDEQAAVHDGQAALDQLLQRLADTLPRGANPPRPRRRPQWQAAAAADRPTAIPSARPLPRLTMRPTLYTVQRDGPGRLSTMAKPRGGDWLDDELHALRRLGVDVVVCALTATELDELGLASEAAAARRAGLDLVAIPIADRGVPDLAVALPALRALAERLQAGQHVVTHCRFGIGRASLLAAALLVLEGIDPDQAWSRLVHARGQHVPDTDQQRQWVARLPSTSMSSRLDRADSTE